MGVGVQRHALAASPSGDKPSTHFTEGFVGSTASMDGCGKYRPRPGFEPRPVQSLASRYTNCFIPSDVLLSLRSKTTPHPSLLNQPYFLKLAMQQTECSYLHCCL